jgi:O-antigen ligase
MSWAKTREFVAPLYLLVCLLFGGSTQSLWFNAALQGVAVIILAWAAIEWRAGELSQGTRRLLLLAGGVLGLVFIQLVPLPPSLWTRLPGRTMVAEGLNLLGLKAGWQSLSLAPYETLSAALTLLPPFAMIAAIVILRAYNRTALTIALLVGAVLGLGLGLLQISSPDVPGASYYLQPEHNGGTPSGFFANPNHMATLLLINIPFLAAFAGSIRNQSKKVSGPSARLMLGGAGAMLMVVGILLNKSLAGIGILIPVLVLSLFVAVSVPKKVRIGTLAVSALLLCGFLATLFSPLNREFIHGEAVSAISTREEFAKTGIKVAENYAPVGSGIGTFQRVYRIFEDPRSIDPQTFVNHAHDDYLEVIIETGAFGLLMLAAFLAWWGSQIRAMVIAQTKDKYAGAGAIASGAVLLHSLVDYPLRTSAISASFAVCLALLAVSWRTSAADDDLRPARHIEIG